MTEILWNAVDAAKATSGQLVGDQNWNALRLSMDSRDVVKGDLFIALKPDTEGDKYRTSGMDGHDFVQSAIDNGAVAVIVDHKMDVNIPQLIVTDTMVALEDLGQFARARAGLQHAIAITGSVGKTGTRDMVDTVFQTTSMRPHASIKSYNNSIGVPYTLSNMMASTDVSISEVGMNQAGEIDKSTRQIKPSIAIITNISEQHIENFNNEINGIVNAKSEIFNGMNSNGIAILPRDNNHYADLVANAKTAGVTKIHSFGEHADADAQLTSCILANNGTRVTANIMGEDIEYTLSTLGKHNAINSLSALLAVKLANEDIQIAAKALAKIKPLSGRGTIETIKSGDTNNPITLIDDTYNAAPVAMKAAFKVLAMIDPGRGGRRIAVLGQMAELGARADGVHADLAMPLQAAGVDLLYCCGQHMKSLYDKMPPANQGAHTDTSKELAEIVPDALTPGDVVLVKGSRGSAMETVVEAMRKMGG